MSLYAAGCAPNGVPIVACLRKRMLYARLLGGYDDDVEFLTPDNDVEFLTPDAGQWVACLRVSDVKRIDFDTRGLMLVQVDRPMPRPFDLPATHGISLNLIPWSQMRAQKSSKSLKFLR